jgi:NAD(P)-dependent dehydrogenase (short-subunit alcohol dehydrogenase family)
VWDILILNSGYLSTPASISDSSIEDWWQSFEVFPSAPMTSLLRFSLTLLTPHSQTNVKGSFIASHIFLPTANPTHSTILGVTSGTISLPSAMTPGISAYQSSKIAQVKMLEFLAAENPRTFVASVHPGMVDTVVFRKSGARAEDLPMDTGQ